MRHPLLHIGLFAALAATATGWFASCSGNPNPGQPVRYAVSYPMQRSLLCDIAGDSAEVFTLIPPGTDPETYEPSVQTLRSLENSRAYFILGTPGFEEAILRKVSDNLSEVKPVDCGKNIPHISDTHGNGETDPHVWNSVRNAITIATAMRDWLVSHDPDHAAGYSRRYKDLTRRLTALDDSIAGILDDAKGKAFVVMHPSLSYFAHDYGLRQIAMETEGKEASPRQLSARMDEARKSGATVMIHDREHSSAAAESVARQLGLTLVSVSLNGDNWAEEMITIAKAIADEK